MTVYGLFFCQDCQAGETCGKYVDELKSVYSTRELAKEALDNWAAEHSGCYRENNEVICYYDTCICDFTRKNMYQAPCTYQAYLKAGDWAGLQKMYIKSLEVKETL